MRTATEARSQKPEGRDPSFAFCPLSSDLRLRTSERGVALIITLILLAVVTFMALTFLAISRRERGAVTTTTDTISAQLTADNALAAAEGQIVANMLATNNPYNFGLLVSTNYINPNGFATGVASPTNVNFDYYNTGPGPLSQGDFLQNLANLYYLPRTPVYMSNVVTRVMENRFYLDLNRNGFFETNGMVVDAKGTETNLEFGDPEWVGVLQHPDQPYGPNNPFVARYAFIAVPIGNALDLNAIYNYAVGIRQQVNNMVPGNDRFMRNQGVGTWEINLAAFLADLNTTEWGQVVGSGATPPVGSATWYQYNEANPVPNVNSGHAFDDAISLLSYRYSYDYNTLAPAGGINGLFPPGLPARAFRANIDYYSDGPVMTSPAGINVGGQIVTWPWSGADNTNHFFDLQELFNPNETQKNATPPGFSDRLLAAGAPFTGFNPNPGPGDSDPTNFYNRYTYYRLVSQMGVESAPEENKLNLNYANAVAYTNRLTGMVTNIAFFPNGETNLVPWTNALQFFDIAADKMLRDYSQLWQVESPSNYVATFNVTNSFGITNIPVWVSNQFVYTPAVQRVLQLAANMYDAGYYYSNNFVFPVGPGNPAALPSVFRPFFNKVITTDIPPNTNVYICGFSEVKNAFQNNQFGQALSVPYSLDDPNTLLIMRRSALGPNYINIYGVPWIIGAKKGFPNFNEFALESVFQLTRKLQVTRPNTNSPISDYQYNQMYNVSLTNQLGVECWNSYTNDYNRAVDILVTNYFMSVTLTNDEDFSTNLNFTISGFLPIPNVVNGVWPGYNPTVNPLGAPFSFQIPLNTAIGVIPASMYRFNVGPNVQEPGHTGPYLTTNFDYPWGDSLFESGVVLNGQSYPQPHWFLMTTNNLQVVMIDHVTGGIIDYVALRGPNSVRDVTSEIISQYDTQPGPNGNDMWNTNIQSGVPSGPIGIISQIGVSLGLYNPGAASGAWNSASQTQRENEIDGFRAFWGLGQLFNNPGEAQLVAQASMTNALQAPYTPSATVVQHYSWQANDPLVHYTASDLNWPGANRLDRSPDDLTNENLGRLNQRYMPWGGNPLLSGADKNPYSLSLKDPLVWQSDDWDFPTNKLPTVGWLGRVHRGTPWQTVYLKAPDVLRGIEVKGGVTNYVGTNVWAQWTGDALLANSQNYDAVNTAPAQDRLLFDDFSTAINNNATRGQLPVNVGASDPNNPQAGLAAWSAIFSGVMVLSNTAAAPLINVVVGAPAQHNGSLVNFTAFPIDPAGPAGLNSALGQLVAGINQTRTNFVNADGLAGSFERTGDILAVPQLTSQSRFLNTFGIQQTNGISDEMYEWLPQQVLSLLRVSDSPRYVIYSYGQTLKPAPNSVYTGGGPYFGMVTNYQVVAEAATRAVVRFNGTRANSVIQTNDGGNISWIVVPSITNNNAVVEEFNALPPN